MCAGVCACACVCVRSLSISIMTDVEFRLSLIGWGVDWRAVPGWMYGGLQSRPCRKRRNVEALITHSQTHARAPTLPTQHPHTHTNQPNHTPTHRHTQTHKHTPHSHTHTHSPTLPQTRGSHIHTNTSTHTMRTRTVLDTASAPRSCCCESPKSPSLRTVSPLSSVCRKT